MRNIYLSFLVLLFTIGKTFSQTPPVPGAAFPQIPFTPMVTDPLKVSQLSSPYSPPWRNNRFKWYGPRPAQDPAAPENWRGYDPTAAYNIITRPTAGPGSPMAITIPHCDEGQDYTFALRYGEASRLKGKEPDYLSADGWELVKQDLGYFHHDNTLSATPNVANDQFSVPYVMLYNKFSGVLRIFGYYPYATPAVGVMLVSLQLNDLEDNYSIPSADNFSGLFNSYGQEYTPLDEPTRNKIVKSSAFFPAATKMFWADFQTAYDPCICFFNSYIKVDFQIVSSATLNAYGGSVSCNSTACPDPSEMVDYLGGFLTDPSSNQVSPLTSGQASYKSFSNMEDDFNNMIYSQQSYLEDKDGLWQSMQKYGKYAEQAGDVLQYIPEPYTQKAAKALKYGGKFMKYFGASMESPLGKATKEFTALSGTVTTSSNLNTNQLRLATPGSPWTKNIPANETEFSKDPTYPLYNEVLGTFAIVNTPKVIEYNEKGKRRHHFPFGCNPGASLTVENGNQFKTVFQFDPNSFKYIFNPAIELLEYKIEVAMQVEFSYRKGDATPFCSPVPNNTVPPTYSNAHLIKKWEVGANEFLTLETPYLELGCLGNVTGFIAFDPDLVFNYVSSDDLPEVEKYVLKVVVTGKSKQLNRFGQPNSFVNLYTVPLEVAPGNLSGVSTPYTSEGYSGLPFHYKRLNGFFAGTNDQIDEILAIETMELKGLFSNLQNSNGLARSIAFNAGESIELLPGFSTVGPFEFTIKGPFRDNCPNVPEISYATITNFCKNSSDPNIRPYTANQGVPRLAASNSNSVPPISSTSTLGYPIPNPTKGKCSLGFELGEAGGYEMVLSNVMGAQVDVLAHQMAALPGKHEVTFETANLEPGVYYITLSANGFRQARKLVVVK